jgi:hypothetical protein
MLGLALFLGWFHAGLSWDGAGTELDDVCLGEDNFLVSNTSSQQPPQTVADARIFVYVGCLEILDSCT